MSRALLVIVATLVLVVACRRQEQLGFDIVRVPRSAYLTPDAAVAPDAGAPDAGQREAGTFRPSIPPLCFAPPGNAPSEDDSVGDPYPECARYHQPSQVFDQDRTLRVRDKVKKPVCCYAVERDEE